MNLMRLFPLSALPGTLLLSLTLCACGSNKNEAAQTETITPVQVAKAAIEPIQRIVTADAILYPIAQSAVTPKISAPVRRFLVNRGDHVRKGQLLAELENGDLASTVSENQALYDQAEAQFQTTTKGTLPEDMTKARTDVETARQALDAARKLYDNRVALVREGALAQKLADDAKVALVQAQSQFDTSQRHLESMRTVSRAGQIKAAQGQLDAAKARVANAEAQAGYAEIRSPIDGVVADRPANTGEMASSGTPIINIVDISEIVARANVPAADISHLKVSQTASIASADGELMGNVSVISPAVDPSSTTIEVWVRVSNPGGRLKPGGTAKVSIQAETIPDAVVIPVAALLSSDGGESIVMVAGSDSVAHEHKVETGIREGDKVQVTEGLKGGENVVIGGGVGLADKSKVEIHAGKHE